MPIYYVICEYVDNPNMWGMYRILEVIKCTMEDVQYDRVNYKKYHEAGRYRVQAYMFVREPDNPFREQAQ